MMVAFHSLLGAFSEDEGNVHEINNPVMNSISDDDSNDSSGKLSSISCK